MASKTGNFDRLRIIAGGISASFEELCCQIFRRAPEAPADGVFRRIKGAGGDGGVEALWLAGGVENWGLQCKWFSDLAASQKTQMKESLDQAISNYPKLARYTFCLPLELTGAKNTKKGKSVGQHERLASWIDEWKKDARFAGVSIDFWDSSEIHGRLNAADPSGGLRRFWFDQEILTEAWFQKHLRTATSQAGKRYSPQLSIKTPVSRALDSFGRTSEWRHSLRRLGANLNDKVELWSSNIAQGKDSVPSLADEAILATARELGSAAEECRKAVAVGVESEEGLKVKDLQLLSAAIALAHNLEPKVKAALEAKHGEVADTKRFREFSAEMNAHFPMAPLDHLRSLRVSLEQVSALISSTEGALPAASAMAIVGPAGIGKTHAVIDISRSRLDRGLLSLISFGDDFNSGTDFWSQLQKKLGLDPTLSRDAMLAYLNAAGEATEHPLAIFVDALNETEPDRTKWKSWLPPAIEELRPWPFLKLCVTCRDTFKSEVFPDHLKLPTIEHNGFAGQEHQAISSFFEHYRLGPPSEPMLQEEFSNPLFLHIVCQALQAANLQALPSGSTGLTQLFSLLLSAKNKSTAGACDYDPREDRVGEAINLISSEMARVQSRHLSLGTAKALMEAKWPSSGFSGSLLNALERESLLSIIERQSSELGAAPNYEVRFTFERIGDHAIALAMIKGLDVPSLVTALASRGHLHHLVESVDAIRRYAGLLDAIALETAERLSTELVDLVSAHYTSVRDRVLGSLQWRSTDSITARTVSLIEEALGSVDACSRAMDTLFKVTTRPGHILNGDFLTGMLSDRPMIERDPFWAYQLEEQFPATDDRVTTLVRLIDWASLSDLRGLGLESARLWCTFLAWLCASPNRKIRDGATKGMVRICETLPQTIPALFDRFLELDDEYVTERVLVAAYGAFLLNPEPNALQAASSLVLEKYFKTGHTPPLNASLRDHGRLIVEHAVSHGVAESGALPVIQPPYGSAWPIVWPTEDQVAPLTADQKRFPAMNLSQVYGVALGTDFARYIVSRQISSRFDVRDAGINDVDLYRWLMNEVMILGYPGPQDRSAAYDRHIMFKHGAGRSKDGWAERLGKKYYWILLRRLLGQISDHVPRRSWTGAASEPDGRLQALELRDIDPTDLRMLIRDEPSLDHWYKLESHVFPGNENPAGDTLWVEAKDFPPLEGLTKVNDGGNNWVVLSQYAAWEGAERRSANRRSYRRVSRDIDTLFCERKRLPALKASLESGRLDNDFSDFQPNDYHGYLGEYPRSRAYSERFAEEPWFERTVNDVSCEATAVQQLRGQEWGYDYRSGTDIPGLLMPAPALVAHRDLRWDGRGGWRDGAGVTQIEDVTWRDDKPSILLCREEYLDAYLQASDRALLVFGVQSKYVAGDVGDGERPGINRETTILLREEGRVEIIRLFAADD